MHPVGRTHLGEGHEGQYPVGPHAGAGEECEEEGAAEMKHYELPLTLIPFPSFCATQGRGSRRLRSEVELGEEGRCGKKVVLDFFLFLITLL